MTVLTRRRGCMTTLAMAFLVSGAGQALADPSQGHRIIRPPDDRADYFATAVALQAIGDSVCAQIDGEMLSDNGDGTYTINAGTLGGDYSPLCDGERFADQPTAANCTATFVGADILITAGHCLEEGGVRTNLDTIYFVFDYAVKSAGVNPSMFNADQVYRAAEIIGLSNVNDTADDWAVVRLDRAVTGRTPVGVRSDDSIAVGQSVVAIGFGAGLPMKFSGNATVQNLVDFGFEADLDIIGGNSGGPIINPDTGLVEAVLSADQGIEDFREDGGCFRATVCPRDPDCDGSFTLLASVMTPDFQTTIRNAIGGAGGGEDDGEMDDGAGDADEDGDGVSDENDSCLGTPDGVEVDEIGCGPDDQLDDDAGGDTTGTRPCGAMGLTPLMFMMMGATLLRRRG